MQNSLQHKLIVKVEVCDATVPYNRPILNIEDFISSIVNKVRNIIRSCRDIVGFSNIYRIQIELAIF
jgi:hypothetical protein